MDLIKITNIIKKDMPLYYREDFSCLALFNDPANSRQIEIPVEFSLESNALGEKSVEIFLKEPIDYPVLPIKESIREHILALDKEKRIR